jgi:hypothetical protein
MAELLNFDPWKKNSPFRVWDPTSLLPKGTKIAVSVDRMHLSRLVAIQSRDLRVGGVTMPP